jgi:hypothetical protein
MLYLIYKYSRQVSTIAREKKLKTTTKLFLSLMFLFCFCGGAFAVPYLPPQPQVYNFCNTPNYTTTAHNTWYFDIVNGNDTTGNGTQGNPWQHPQTIFSTVNSVGPRLNSLNGSGAIQAGDVVLLENGNYGTLVVGTPGSLDNQTNFLTISADASATNVVFTKVTINPFSKLYFYGFTVSANGTGNNTTDALVLFSDGGLSFPITDVIFNGMTVNSQSSLVGWSQVQWTANANNGFSVMASTVPSINCAAIENSNVYNVLAGMQFFVQSGLLLGNNIYMTGDYAIDTCGNGVLVTKNIIHEGNSIGPDNVPGKTMTNCNKTEIFDNIIWKQSGSATVSFIAQFYDGIVNFDSDITGAFIHNNLVITDAQFGIGGQSFHNSTIQNNTVLQDGTVSSNGNPSVWVGNTASGSTQASSNTIASNNFAPALGNATYPFYNTGSGVVASNNLMPYNAGGTVISDYNSSGVSEVINGNSGSATNYTQAISGGVNTVDKTGGYTNQIRSYNPITFSFNLRPANGSLLNSMGVGTKGFGTISPSVLPRPGCLPNQACGG